MLIIVDLSPVIDTVSIIRKIIIDYDCVNSNDIYWEVLRNLAEVSFGITTIRSEKNELNFISEELYTMLVGPFNDLELWIRENYLIHIPDDNYYLIVPVTSLIFLIDRVE